METIIGANGSGGDQPPADVIKDSDTANFGKDVVEASMALPVIVDFWAPWCGPCKQLGPALEKAVRGTGGAVRLVKVNVDENKSLAEQLRIQSIPAVYAFFQGQPIDGFVGAQGESQIKAFVDRLLKQSVGAPGPSPLDQALEQAQAALDGGQHGAASALFGQVLQAEPDNETALAGVIRCALAAGDTADAQKMFDALPAETRDKSAFVTIKAALELAEQEAGAGSVSELRAQVERDPRNHQARFDLALALHAEGRREEAAEELLEIIRRDRAWNEEAARAQLLKFLEAWGPGDPLTQDTRRRLSSLLFS
ncbi:MAG: co-chaperone YbbN [Kiloniellales bacterium]|jgi:putative thioredoxin